MITLRLATSADSQFLFELHCEEETQRYARDKDHRHIPARDEHEAWLADTLNSQTRRLMIVEDDGQPVGMVRLDGREVWEVSIAVLPHMQGKGCAGAALELVRSHYEGPLLATIDPQNERSLRLFRSAGYEQAYRLG